MHDFIIKTKQFCYHLLDSLFILEYEELVTEKEIHQKKCETPSFFKKKFFKRA